MTKEEIFEKNAKEILVHYSKEDFKKSFPTLLKVFYKSIDEYTSHLQREVDELKDKVNELEIPHGVKLCDCPECGAEIQLGISDELKKRLESIKLRK